MSSNDRTVLVTGGTSGIGEAIARAFARDGAHVIVTGRNEERGEHIVRELGGGACFIRADLERLDEVQRLASEVNGVDVLVNNAGVFPFAPTHEVDSAEFDQTYALNVRAPFFLTAALAPRMAANGGGAIVNVTTMAASFGMAGGAPYRASQAALTNPTEVLAARYRPQSGPGHANGPGPTRTPGTHPMGDALQQIASNLPLNRPADT